MAHQLRRIIGVNIYNPKDDRPSGRIAIMDPRGGVLAVGENGAGKTTFLRLLPLFYGATASQILRGTGRRSMIAYTLPDASSAVAFEYERETPDDLRTVVVHCRPNEDVPQFHIVESGFREDFFYDENDEFVRREDFKSRIEAMRVGPGGDQRIEVSPKLHLHQYRSVILKERLPTKEGAELARLAERHSLGPKRLVNLNQIAAAMANEKISFRDLQNIVIDQVSDQNNDAAAASNNRVLLKNRDDVTGLIEDCAHLGRIMQAEPMAKAMLGKVETLKAHHFSLCTLHVAVKAALAQSTRDIEGLKASEIRERSEYDAAHGRFASEIAATTTALADARKELRAFAEAVDTAQAQQAGFESQGAESLAAEQDQEDRLAAEGLALQRELEPLDEAAGAVAKDEERRLAAIDRAHADRLAQIDQRLMQASEESTARGREIEDARDEAEASWGTPARLAEIADERALLQREIGALDAQIHRPTEPEEARVDLERANEGMTAAGDALSAARAAVHTASKTQREAKDAVDSVLRRVQAAEAEGAQLADAFVVAERQATPPAGSLLEFLRKTEPTLWAGAAKVLSPQLLERTDLRPRILEDGGDETTVAAGAIGLNVTAIETPAWVDAAETQAKLKSLREAGAANAERLAQARQDAVRANKAFASAETVVSQRLSDEALAVAAQETAVANLRRAKGYAQNQREAAKVDAQSRKKIVEDKLRSLSTEDILVRSAEELRREKVRAEFRQQREAIDKDLAAARERLARERTEAAEAQSREHAQVADEVKRELEGRGVDPLRRKALKDEIARLHSRLTSIATHRHVVHAWRDFMRDVAPRMEEMVARQEAQERRCKELADKLRTLEKDDDALRLAFTHEMNQIRNRLELRETEHAQLTTLRAGPIKDFLDYVPENLSVDWGAVALQAEVRKNLAALEELSSTLARERRQLRDILTGRPGPITQWVELHERDLPDRQTLLEHQNTWEQVLTLIAWFRPDEHGPYIEAINTVLEGFLSIASSFVRDLELFDRKVETFNRELQSALKGTEHFARFRNLSVTVRSQVRQLKALATLNKMRDVHDASFSSYRTAMGRNRSMPGEESIQLIRAFRDLLPADGVLRVNLNEQIRLECSLEENGKKQTITNEEEFKAVSSNGNTALITAMFLMGFVQMIRGKDSPVRLIWISDEVGRFSPSNMEAFLQTLDAHRIDVVSAAPSIDPAIARFFPRICMFESNGQIKTSKARNTQAEEDAHVAA